MKAPIAVLALLIAISASARAADPWQEGKHYFLVRPAQPTDVGPGKIEVLEVFSYACPYCYRLYPTIDKLKAKLPKNAVLRFLPASFNPAEDWPMFQRAFYAADALGVAEKTHDAIFDAVWKTGELAVADAKTNRLKNPLPTIADAARVYSRLAGVKPSEFLAAANSFSVNVKMNRADELVRAYRVDGTPTLIVNGEYRLDVGSAGGYDQVVDLVMWLVAKETKQ